jgi:alpha-galactosidase/6-phospho-beta-glucosidase family protein
VNTDPTSQRKIGGAVQMAIILGDAFTIDWRMEDDSVVTHDKNAMINMGVLAGQHVSLCQANKNTLDAAVEAAESVEDVEAVDISLGWPA